MLPLLLAHHWVALSQVPRQPGARFALVGGGSPQFTNPSWEQAPAPEQGNPDCFTKALTQPFSKESQSEPGLSRFHPSYRSGVRVGGFVPKWRWPRWASLCLPCAREGPLPPPARPGPSAHVARK